MGVAAHQIAKLRDALRGGTVGARGGTLTVQHGGSVSAVIPLDQTSMEAVLALLIEREAALLAGFGVQVEKTR